jgi:hypothetical protein
MVTSPAATVGLVMRTRSRLYHGQPDSTPADNVETTQTDATQPDGAAMVKVTHIADLRAALDQHALRRRSMALRIAQIPI